MKNVRDASPDRHSHDRHVSDEGVLDLLHGLMHKYRSLQHRHLRDSPHEITTMDARLLKFFSANPGATQSDLADYSGRDKAQLARLIKGLRERGLLVAEADPDDRRSTRLQLSAEGQKVQRALLVHSRRLGVKAIQNMTAEEHRVLMDLLKRMRANLADPE